MSVKPTPSIAIEQDSVDLAEGRPAKLVVRGRHDPCIAPRAVPVAEAACALALLDAWLAFPPEAGMAGRPGCAR
jgi:chorismate synthase